MISPNYGLSTELSSPVRHIEARVEFYEGSTLVETCNCHDSLIKFEVSRVGESSKFFGFGLTHRLNVHLLDKERQFDFSTANSIKVGFKKKTEDGFLYPYPTFFISQVRRDENTNELSITAYDLSYRSSEHTVSQITATTPRAYIEQAAGILGATGVVIERVGDAETCFNTNYETVNFEGNEIIQEGLDDVAEITQTIYFINSEDKLVFKRLDKAAAADLAITKSDYITLSTSTNRRLSKIMRVTELGDNLSASILAAGSTQYVRENAFWSLAADIDSLLQSAIDAVGGLTINQFECDWRGNILLEPGDKITTTTKDNDIVTAYILDDVITYEGSLSEKTQWNYEENDTETADNPVTLGEKMKQTSAFVDKAKQEIELIVGKTEGLETDVANLKVTTEGIESTVTSNTDGIAALEKKTSQSMTADEVEILVEEKVGNAGSEVKTSTGFTFDKNGLTIAKSGSSIETQITEDGMTVSRIGDNVLVANNEGVMATNLHATTYLIIGTTSRFEDYENGLRTACFWIGTKTAEEV